MRGEKEMEMEMEEGREVREKKGQRMGWETQGVG